MSHRLAVRPRAANNDLVRRAFYVWVIAAAACTDLSGLATGGSDLDGSVRPKDAGSDAVQSADGSPPPIVRSCDPTAAFGPPVRVDHFDGTADYVKGAILSPNELEVFYLKYNPPASDWELRHARREKVDDPWGTVVTIGLPTTPDGALSLTASGLKLYYWTVGSNYKTTRVSINVDTFVLPSKYDVTSGPQAHLVASDDMAYFSKVEGDAGFEKFLKRATANTGGFSLTATTVPNVHQATFSDDHPVLNTTETALYFSSNRPGGKGLADIWVSRRQSKQGEFGAPVHVPELSTDEPDQITWVSDDECRVFLDRASHVYVATRK